MTTKQVALLMDVAPQTLELAKQRGWIPYCKNGLCAEPTGRYIRQGEELWRVWRTSESLIEAPESVTENLTLEETANPDPAPLEEEGIKNTEIQ